MTEIANPETSSGPRRLGKRTGDPSWTFGRPDDVPIPLVVLDLAGRVVDYNRFAAELFGGEHGLLRLDSPFMPLVGASVRSYVKWRDDQEAGPLTVRLRVGNQKITADLTKTRIESDPPVIVLAVSVDSQVGPTGAHRLAFDEADHGVFVAETSGRVVAANPALLSMVGLDIEQVEGKDWRHLFMGHVSPAFARDAHRDLLDLFEWHGRLLVQAADGVERVLDVSLRMRHFEGPDSASSLSRAGVDSVSDLSLVGYIVDETADEAAQQALRAEARTDALTGILNRAGFLEDLHERFDHAQRSGSGLSLLYIDLDNFKTLNDNFGHRYGDVLLEAFAKRLRASLKRTDVVGRVGGDEFVVLFDPGLEPSNLQIVVDKLRERLLDDYRLDDMAYTCTASFGSAEYPWDAGSASQLLEYADHAMYQAKSRGRNSHARFDRSGYSDGEDREAMLRAIEVGLDETQFVPYFKPMYDVETRELSGAEARVRWVDQETDEMIRLPDEFLPSIEGSPTSVRLGVMMVEQVIAELEANTSTKPVPVSINLSSVQCRSEEIVSLLEDAALRSSSLAERLRVELTESVFTPEDPVVTRNLARLHAAGVGLTLDDFGVGPTSLMSLRAHEFSMLKIHRRVLDGASANRTPQAELFASMVAMAKTLEIDVAATGVENEPALELVARTGCDFAQGPLLGGPMPPSEFHKLLH